MLGICFLLKYIVSCLFRNHLYGEERAGCFSSVVERAGCFSSVVERAGCFSSVVERAGCFSSVVERAGCLVLLFPCYPSLTLLRCTVDWSVVCDCGIS